MGYQLNMNNQTPVSVSAVPFNPQTQSFTPEKPTPAIAPATPNIPNLPTPNPTITADNLGVQKIDIPAPQAVTAVPQPVNQAEQILAQTAVAETEAQKASQNLSKNILSLIPELQGQTQALSDAQRAAGLPAMKQNLQNINNQILQKQAELQQDDIRLVQAVQNIEDKPIAMEFITGQQQSVQRNAQIARALKASEIGVLNATAIGMQGNIALAEQTAKQAVETKYAPYKEALETYKLQLEALTPLLNADEKKQAREQEIKTKLAFNDIEKRQKAEESVSQMIVNAAAQNAPQTLLAKAQAEKDPAKAAMILGQYAGDFYKTELLKNQIATEKAQRAKYYADIENSKKELAAKLNTSVPAASAKIEASQSAYNLANELKTLPGKGGAVGFGFKKSVLGSIPFVSPDAIAGTDRANYEAKFAQLKDTLASANLDKLKGAMSDKDIEFLRNIGTALNPSMSEEAFDAELEKIKTTMTKVPGVIPVAPPNPFQKALGQSTSAIPGSSIVEVSPKGDFQFKIPTN